MHSTSARYGVKTIAVVEDNPDNMLLITVLLEDSYRLNPYEDGMKALDGMRQAVPDLVLLDISLPGIDGIEVLMRMRRDDALKSVPVIALTAHAGPADRQHFIESGFTDYVTKPIVDENILKAAISRLLG